MRSVLVALLVAGIGSGVSAGFEEAEGEKTHQTPVVWDIKTGENLAWKAAVPGLGHASPAIWGDTVLIVTAVPAEGDASYPVGLSEDLSSAEDAQAYTWEARALNLASGKVAWKTVLHEGMPRAKRHRKNSYATPTPAISGEVAVVNLGSQGLFGLDSDGGIRWKVDLGVLQTGFYADNSLQWGYASSPVIFEDTVIVQADTDQDGFLAAFALDDGEERWRVGRSAGQSWSTPAVIEGQLGPELVVNAAKSVEGFDPRSGEGLWELNWDQDIVISSPVPVGDGRLLVNSGKGRSWQPILVIRTGHKGDLTLEKDQSKSEAVVWSRSRGGTIVTTPAVDQERLYTLVDIGVLRAFSLSDGALRFQERIEDSFLASPVIVGEKLYLTAEDGTVFVVKPGSEYELLAKNDFDEPCVATPQAAAGTLVFRCLRHVFAVREGATGPGGQEKGSPSSRSLEGSLPE